MNLWGIFSTSFLIALTGAMMPGPVLAFTIRDSAARGYRSGPLIILGHALLELTLIAALLLGLSSAFRSSWFLAIVGIGGGAVIIGMGISGWAQSRADLKLVEPERRDDLPRQDVKTVLGGIMTSLSNPYWFLWWATIGLTYLGRAWKYSWLGIAGFYGGHVLADLAWYSIVSAAVAKGRNIFKTQFYRWLLGLCSLFLLGLGAYFIRAGVLFSLCRR